MKKTVKAILLTLSLGIIGSIAPCTSKNIKCKKAIITKDIQVTVENALEQFGLSSTVYCYNCGKQFVATEENSILTIVNSGYGSDYPAQAYWQHNSCSIPVIIDHEKEHFKNMIIDLEPDLKDYDLTIQRHDQSTQVKANSGISYKGQYFDFYIGESVQNLPLAKQKALLKAAISDIVTPKENSYFHAMIEKIYPDIKNAGIYRNTQADNAVRVTRAIQYGSKYLLFFVGKEIQYLPIFDG